MNTLLLIFFGFTNLATNHVNTIPMISTAIIPQEIVEQVEVDTRAARVDAYFAKRNMPLEGYGAQFIETADKYNMDWRLLPAIAVRESSGGKNLMNNNPFGWGSAKIPFEDFNHAIDIVGMHLSGNHEATARYYKDKDVYDKLYSYNGTVLPSYPNEVIAIMDLFETTSIDA
ncbi:hypothetical protein KKG22_01945 [Patescibacteria group bacterium]|nr:hypothetical protein [Patescibacteria group bacterium]MBU1721883.1 hypothetical protein [Patescibacteria group bacterium]MBU1900885.1 hypothetical protein [Patescibacteria group bacterium]